MMAAEMGSVGPLMCTCVLWMQTIITHAQSSIDIDLVQTRNKLTFTSMRLMQSYDRINKVRVILDMSIKNMDDEIMLLEKQCSDLESQGESDNHSKCLLCSLVILHVTGKTLFNECSWQLLCKLKIIDYFRMKTKFDKY